MKPEDWNGSLENFRHEALEFQRLLDELERLQQLEPSEDINNLIKEIRNELEKFD